MPVAWTPPRRSEAADWLKLGYAACASTSRTEAAVLARVGFNHQTRAIARCYEHFTT